MKALLFVAIALQVAVVGAQVPPRDVWAHLRRPAWIVRTALAMFVAAPLFALLLINVFEMPRLMQGAMVLLAISAAAPLLPGKLVKLGIDPAHDTALTVVTALLAILVVPNEVRVLGDWFGRDASIAGAAVARVLATSFIAPLAAGMLLNLLSGGRVGALASRLSVPASALLGILVLVFVVAQAGTLFALLRQSALVVVLFAAGSLLIGHVLGGSDPRDRTSLAIATVTRHPGLALLIATTNFPQARDVPSAVLAFVLGMALAAIPYTAWQKRQLTAAPASPVAAA